MFDSNGLVLCSKRFRAMAVVVVVLLTLLCPGVGPFFPSATQAQTFSDPGFSSEVVTTLPQFLPVGVTWASDGRMFIWQRNGVIRIYKNGQLLPTPFLDISANVNTFDDRGMLGLALHPNFAVNGYVYVIYVREDGGNPNDSSPKTERLSRFIANAQNPDVAISNSETVLMTIPTQYHHHENGTLRFGSDGKLFVGHGEDTTAGNADVAAFVAQDLNDPRGKILRITEDGNAPGDNPFDDGTNSIRSKVYDYGLRNPFRFTLHPVSGEPYIGDVGWDTWEEFSGGRGKNFGWPCYEGVDPQPLYQGFFPTQCAPLTSNVVTPPLLSYPHPGIPEAAGAPFVGNSAIGGPFYTATAYPDTYRNTWFISDYAAGWIRRMTFNQFGDMTGTVPFATGLQGPVDLELGPDGLLYYVEINTGRVVRIRFNGVSAVATATPSSGYSPLTVNFSSAGSIIPSGTSVSYLWEFGDGQTSTAANPSHTYVSATVKTFTAKLTITASANQSSSATVKVTVGSVPPTPTIQSPINGTSVLPGQTVVYQGSATDPDDGTIPSSGLNWTILLHHNDHTHTQVFTTGATGSVAIQYHGIGTYSYEFQLTATDSSGLSRTASVNLPVLTDSIPPSDPSGLVATPIGSSQVNLTWIGATDNSGSVTYLVERCQSTGCINFVQIASVGTASYNDTTVTGGTTYNYRVRAVDSSGNQSVNSTNTSVTTGGGSGSTNLVTALGMNEGSGTTLADASGNNHTGTLVNGPLWVASQATYGQSVSFDGVNDAVSVANPSTYNFGTADFTIELWVKRNGLGGGQRHLLSKCDATTWVVGCKELYFNANNQLVFGSFSTSDTLASTIADTNWHHVAVTFADSTNTLRMYVDGVLITTATKALEADGGTHVVTLGNLLGSNPFSGQLDELRIYNRVLTLAEIQTDRSTPIAPGSTDSTPPSTVAGLNATAVIGPQINLSWTAATDNIAVTGYRVERCQGLGCTTFAQIATPSGTTFSDTGLAASTAYSYRVKAVDGAGNVSVNYSNVATTTTAADTTAPTAPTSLAATTGTNQITLTWAASTDNGGSGLAGYEVLRCQGTGCTTFTLIATVSTTSYTDTGLAASTPYTYQVRAVDGALNRSSSASISATTGSGGGGGIGLVTALGMNEGSGTTLGDASGNNHTGTLVNGPLWVASQATYGQSVSFDGINDAVSVANPNTYNFGTADFTIELWVKRNVLGGGQRHLLSKCDATTWVVGCKELYFNTSNQLTFGSFSTGDVFASTIADTNWHHVAVTFADSTNTLRMYVDGVLITAITQALEADGATHVVTFGNLHGSNPFSGQLDELRIYNRVLTLAEIQADRATPLSP